MTHTFREIAFGSPAYDEAVALREALLRRPLGLPRLDAASREAEANARHYGLFSDARLDACLVAVPLEGECWRLRQVCVCQTQQGRGLGGLLMRQCEQQLAAAGARELRLHARKPVIDFYRRLGYHGEGSLFVEIGLEHLLMIKKLV